MLRLLFNLLLLVFFIGLLTAGGVVWYLLPGLPDTNTLKDVRLQTPLRVYSVDNALIAEFGEKRRRPVQRENVPEKMVQAFLASEDNRFYEHPGVDWQGITRAVINELLHGNRSQGGSTITMQVARNFFLTREKSYTRKLREILLAFKIEQDLSKDEILELYLNKIYLGHRAYGVGAAAQVYYGIDLNQLSLPQIAMIAGLPKAPSTMNPITNSERALQRRNYVLGRMLHGGYISEKEHEHATASPISARLHAPTVELNAPYVAEMVRAQMLNQYGEKAYTHGFSVYTTINSSMQRAASRALRNALNNYDRRHGYRGPEGHLQLPLELTQNNLAPLLLAHPQIGNLIAGVVTEVHESSVIVYTRDHGWLLIEWNGLEWARPFKELNRRGKTPKVAEEILKSGDLIRVEQTPDYTYRLAELPQVEGALVALTPSTGALQALAGGFDFNQSKFNRVTQAQRQPGSNFKPFIYSAALEKGYTTASQINDAPIVFDDPGLESAWRPENYSGRYFGPTRLREALYKSRNLVSIRLLRSIGIDHAINYATKFGFNENKLPKNLSLALGSTTATPLQILTGFSVFANGGYQVEPYLIKKILNYDEDEIFHSTPLRVCNPCDDITGASSIETNGNGFRIAEQVVEPRNNWLITSILKDTILKGTGRKARKLGRKDLAGKTGTTNEQVDSWFSGFNTNLAATAWVGFDQSAPMGSKETGARAALPMWIDFMETALDGMPEESMPQPEGIITARIDPKSGELATAANRDAIFEYFREEFAPKRKTDTTHIPQIDPYSESGVEEQLF